MQHEHSRCSCTKRLRLVPNHVSIMSAAMYDASRAPIAGETRVMRKGCKKGHCCSQRAAQSVVEEQT